MRAVPNGMFWMKPILVPGQWTAVYPFGIWRGEPFVGRVERVVKNKFGRYSYVINNKKWEAEEMYPAKAQKKLRVPYGANT